MARIVVVGGGFVGLATALGLAREGHDVTVLEKDPDRLPGYPGDAWQAWQRPGIAQFRQPHMVQAAGSQILAGFLPEVQQALLGAEAASFDLLSNMPPFIEDRASRPGDERFVAVTARRPVLEYAIAGTAEGSVDVRRGVAVTELLTGQQAAPGVPHVTGVRTSSGEHLAADLIIDSMGRGSVLPRWLADLGARPLTEQAEDSGFTYYSRYFRAPTGALPQFVTGLLTPFDCYSLLTVPGDAGTWSVTIYISSRDQALKELRHEEKWSAMVKACPLHAHFLDGEPLTDVWPMSGVVDRHRRAVVGGAPVVTGVISVGDSVCCSNPSLGRGISLGLMQAVGTVEVVRDHLGDPVAFALAHDQMIQDRVMPWYWNTVGLDRGRKAEMDAAINGQPAQRSDGRPASALESLFVAMLYDADIFRACIEFFSVLALPEQILARPGVSDRVTAIASERDALPAPGPSRSDLLRLLA